MLLRLALAVIHGCLLAGVVQVERLQQQQLEMAELAGMQQAMLRYHQLARRRALPEPLEAA